MATQTLPKLSAREHKNTLCSLIGRMWEVGIDLCGEIRSTREKRKNEKINPEVPLNIHNVKNVQTLL